MGYIRLGLALFFTITRELRVVERNGLQIRDPEGILYISNASNTKKNVDFFSKNFSKTRDHTNFKIS